VRQQGLLGRKVWQQATQRCRKSQKSNAWKDVTKKDRKAGALWPDTINILKPVT